MYAKVVFQRNNMGKTRNVYPGLKLNLLGREVDYRRDYLMKLFLRSRLGNGKFKKKVPKVGITGSVSISKTDAILFYWLFAVSHGNILLVVTFRPVRSPIQETAKLRNLE